MLLAHLSGAWPASTTFLSLFSDQTNPRSIQSEPPDVGGAGRMARDRRVRQIGRLPVPEFRPARSERTSRPVKAAHVFRLERAGQAFGVTLAELALGQRRIGIGEFGTAPGMRLRLRQQPEKAADRQLVDHDDRRTLGDLP